MTNHRKVKPRKLTDPSPCPFCEEMMETPGIDPVTGKGTTTTCPRCGTQRTIMMPDASLGAGGKVWN